MWIRERRRGFGFYVLSALLVVRPLSAQLVEEWLAVYDGPAGKADVVQAMAIDGLGNVYVTGSSEGVDTHGDYSTLKYDPAGKELWVARYNGPRPDQGWDFGSDSATGIAVDDAGNVYVTGASGYSCPGLRGCFHREHATVKYDAAGNEVWVSRNVDGFGGAVALDRAGNVHVAGPGGLLKLDPQGKEIWRVESAACGVAGLVVDETGNVYVTGGCSRCMTAKYDAGGKKLWAALYEGADPNDLAVDSTGNVYVLGTFTSSSESQFDYVTVKYDPAGQYLWAARYDGPGRPASNGTGPNRNEYAHALAVDRDGSVYVTGQSIADPFNFDYATVKYSADGRELWVARHSNVATGARAIGLSPGGAVYVSGDGALLTYDAAGNEIGVVETGFRSEVMALDAAGNVYLGGFRREESTILDYVTAKYAAPHLSFRRGDANEDAVSDLSDAVFILLSLFAGGRAPACLKSADIDDSGSLEISDPLYLLEHLFLGGPAPVDPFSACGPDPTADALSCQSVASCP